MIRFFVITCFLITAPLFASAQATDEFTIRVFGAEDTEAPSTTTIQSIVPVGPNQVNLQWATSTDNYNVFGYVLSRDGAPLATTTATSFIDTSVIASTTYVYTVQAFDGVPNYSTSSLPATTTTPAIPVAIEESLPGSGTTARVVLASLDIITNVSSARVLIETRRPARVEFRIGETTSYELGYIAGNKFISNHNIPIGDLRPDTRYFYEVVGYTPFGMQTVLRTGSFVTDSDALPLPPSNVQNFVGEVEGSNVVLTWQMPESDGLRVRIVRSHFGYPSFVNDGVVVYEGVAERTTDLFVLNQYDKVFYTAFVVNADGLISSGAIVRVVSDAFVNQPAVNNVGNNNGTQEVSEGSLVEGENSVIEIDQPSSLGMPASTSIYIQQAAEVYTFASSSVTLTVDDQFVISIPADKIQGDFKTLIVTMSDPRGSGKTFSFLLRLNAERTAYQAVIAPVIATGVSTIMLEVYDYESAVVARYATSVEFVPGQDGASSTLEMLRWHLNTALWLGVASTPFIVLWLLWFIFKRRREA